MRRSWLLALFLASPCSAEVTSYYPCAHKIDEPAYICTVSNGEGATVQLQAGANVECMPVVLETESALECHVKSEASPEPPPAAPTIAPYSTVSNVDTVTRAERERAISGVATGAPSTQAGTRKAAETVASLGASHEATVGALYCAEGAVKAYEGDKAAAGSLAKCQQKLDVAEKLTQLETKASGKKNAIRPDAEVLKEAGSAQTLDRFEKAFDVGPSEFLDKMLGSGTSMGAAPGVLKEMTEGKMPPDRLDALFAEAERAYQRDSAAAHATASQGAGVLFFPGVPEFGVSTAGSSGAPEARAPSQPVRFAEGGGASFGIPGGLRAAVAKAGESRRPSSESRPPADLKNLSASSSEFFSGLEADPEASLFLRVKKKLRSHESFLVNRRR